MAYITYEELVIRYPVIETKSLIESDVSSYMMHYAEKEVESRLAARYSIPFSAAHPTIKDLCFDMAYYKALFPADPDKAEKIMEALDKRFDRILEGTEKIITGSGFMDPEGAGVDIWSTVEDYHPVFSMLGNEDVLTEIDSSQLYDLADERA